LGDSPAVAGASARAKMTIEIKRQPVAFIEKLAREC
jgi:hypothetical protein